MKTMKIANCRTSMTGLVLLLMIPMSGCSLEFFFPPLSVAEQVDLTRYAGVWYEIAKYPNNFEEGCVGSTAEYTLMDDGTVAVLNTCREETLDGAIRTIEGFASVTDPQTNAKLGVSFFPPFSAPYWILELGDNYEYAMVGEPSRTFLWILSRTPTMDEATYQALLATLPEKGYDPDRLERTLQPEN